MKTKESNHKLTGKLILRTTVTNKSPLLVASGKGEEADFEVIKDSDGNPFIPASGYAGMLRESFELLTNLNKEQLRHKELFWGSKDAEGDDLSQSHIIIDDLKLISGYQLITRDGVAISEVTGIAIPNNKYDYELIEPGAKFNLNAEVTIRTGFDKTIFLQFLDFMVNNGINENYQQGAFKSSGFGSLFWEDIQAYDFDFAKNNKEDAKKWFQYLEEKLIPGSVYPFTKIQKDFKSLPTKKPNKLVIEGNFEIKNTLIIGSKDVNDFPESTKAPDKTHLKNSLGESILTGKSLKGPIRHRALKILNTLADFDSEKVTTDDKSINELFIDQLFGFVDEKKKEAKASRIKSDDTKITNANKDQIQTRIKIDRFTGGTIESALMQSQPLWHDKEIIKMALEIENCEEKEAALVLLVMKDLMNEDLPIGGEKAIGRGILKGLSLSLNGEVKGEEVNLAFNSAGMVPTDTEKIKTVNNWVNQLQNQIL